MQISQNIKLKQSQSLVMTPQLQQAIKLLQLNNLELCDLVNKELEENPFLENQNDEEDFEVSDEKTDDLNNSFENGESLSDEPKNDDYENRYDLDHTNNSFNKNNNSETLDPGSIAEQTVSEKLDLKKVLRNQAQIEFSDKKQKEISEILIDYIEPTGWITYDLKEIS